MIAFETYHHVLRYGSSYLGIKGSDGVIIVMDHLYYQSSCSNLTNIECLSFQELYILIQKGITNYLNFESNSTNNETIYQELNY